MQTVHKSGQWKHLVSPTGLLYRILTLFLIINLLLPTSGVQAQPSTIVHAQGSTIVTVDTDSIVIDPDADTSSVDALLEHRGGEERVISFPEALTAVNNTGPGFTINFNLSHGAKIPLNSQWFLRVSNTTIEGDVDGDEKPDVMLDAPTSFGFAVLVILSDHNTIQHLAIPGTRNGRLTCRSTLNAVNEKGVLCLKWTHHLNCRAEELTDIENFGNSWLPW